MIPVITIMNTYNIDTNTTNQIIQFLVVIVISDMAMPMALVTAIMVAVVTIILPSPTKAAS